jgi:serine/threonine-protein kinase
MLAWSSGYLLDGKYRIEHLLGEGGMGRVYSAHHLALDQPVAIKCLHDDAASDGALRQRFLREARAAAALTSPHVAKATDVAEEQATGTPYIVMELLRGRDLDQERTQAAGIVPVRQLLEWTVQVCAALAEAHEKGIVHRDIKPSNIFIAETHAGRIAKVLDFGIAKTNNIIPGITVSSNAQLCGTPHYLSPEQVRGSGVDHRTDIWALSVVLYELLSGRPPFDGGSITALAVAIVNDRPTPLQTLRPDLPYALCELVSRGLEKDANIRIASMGEFAAALRRVLDTWTGTGAAIIQPLQGRTVHSATPVDAQTVAAAMPALPGPRRTPRATTWAAMAAMLATVSFGAVWGTHRVTARSATNNSPAAERAEDKPPTAAMASPAAPGAPSSLPTAAAVADAPPTAAADHLAVASARASASPFASGAKLSAGPANAGLAAHQAAPPRPTMPSTPSQPPNAAKRGSEAAKPAAAPTPTIPPPHL